ncbi:MAG: molecular chaperone HtpG [Melioribacter sp.]|uniref:molecular chaperone HtpG n=1 Tax=Rosettibacter primus TaxID=3111523 RepID=UPI00247DDAE1|nr:molecular chaperone HtpG [Melioribacter sp.]
MSDSPTVKKYEFKAEVKKLLDILVHSLYTSREIFLRELISNASDALDKLRFESNRGTAIVDKDLPLEIKISNDEKNKLLIVSDTGIGMNRDELITNIGTIAKSGTEEFLKILSESKAEATNLIGKFGIGFYSVFMVAKEVVIKTKSFRPEDEAVQWKSDGLGEYEITTLEEKIPRGTKIEIYLKDDATEFAEKWRLESIIKKHSNFISYPIYIGNEKINTISAIWREPKSSITKEQYNEFYKFLTYDSEEPADIIHKSIDAPIQFNALLFIPKKSSEYFWIDRENYGLDLYVRRVLIQHKNKDLLPEYLSFVKGVVDSEDLPLNISRETLQENIIFNKIASSVTTTVLTYLIEKAKNEREGYSKFWKEHGKVFKLGYTDFVNKDKYIELLRFNSSKCKDEEELISLEEYISRKLENQKEIYYASGINRNAIDSDPHMEIFKNKNLEVLYLYDPIDELILTSLGKYKDYDFKSIETVDARKLEEFKSLTDAKKEVEELSSDDKKHFSSLLSKMKKILGDKVEDVIESKRLVDSAACLVLKDNELTNTMQKILRITNKNLAPQKKILEVNPDNILVRNLIKIFKSDSNDEFIRIATEQLYDLAQLNDSDLEDIHSFIKRSSKILEESSNWYLKIKNYQ